MCRSGIFFFFGKIKEKHECPVKTVGVLLNSRNMFLPNRSVDVTAVSASSVFVQYCKWQIIVEDKLGRRAIDAEFLWGTALEKSPRKTLHEREGKC